MPRHIPTPEERDERIVLPLDPETALRALLAVKPEVDDVGKGDGRDSGDRGRQT